MTEFTSNAKTNGQLDDYLNPALGMMSQWFDQRHSADEPMLFVVEGKSGSGKSMLAKKLSAEGHAVSYVDLRPSRPFQFESPQTPDPRKYCDAHTVIFDDPDPMYADALKEAVEFLLGRGKSIVIMAQLKTDVGPELLGQAGVAVLDKSGLNVTK